MKKSLLALAPSDFESHPAWRPADDLEDEFLEVEPAEINVVDWEGIYLIACTITLADGTTRTGYVRFSDGNAVVMFVDRGNDTFGDPGLAIGRNREEQRERLAQSLSMSFETVFPLRFESKIKFHLGGWIGQ